MKFTRIIAPILRFLKAAVITLLPFVIIAGGVGGAYWLIKMRKAPEKRTIETIYPLVKVQRIEPNDIQMVVSGYGSVRPKVEVNIVPEVSGKAVEVHPQFKAGGFIKAGEPLVKIDPRDYELAVQQADAAVADAQVRVDTEVAEAEVAKNEWAQLHPDTEPTSPLVLREPQIRQAKAALASAKAQQATAKLRLDRTSLSLPFDVRIMDEKVDVGQYLMAGQSIGSAYGIEVAEIEVPLEDRELKWFDVLMDSGNESSPHLTPAKVITNFGGARHEWPARVVRTVGQVDRMSRLISVVVEVARPFEASDSRPPLLPGTFVEVRIQGRTLTSALAVPRDAIHGANDVWLVDDGHMRVDQLDVVRSDKKFAYAKAPEGKAITIITSTLDTPVDGMGVRVRKADGSIEEPPVQTASEAAN